MPTYNILKNIYWVSPIKNSLSKRPSPTRICEKSNIIKYVKPKYFEKKKYIFFPKKKSWIVYFPI